MPNNTEPIPEKAYEIDLYAVLQIMPEATAVDVRTAFRGLILKHHPDKVQPSDRTAAHGQYLEISFAYSILGDADKRKIYDDVRYLLEEKEKIDATTKQRSGKKAERPPTPRPDDSPFRPRHREHSDHKKNSHTNTGRQGQQQGPDNGPFWRFGSEPRSDPQPAHNKLDDASFRRWAHVAQPDSQYPAPHFYNDSRSSNEAAGSGRSKMKGHHSKVREDGYQTGSEYDPPIFDYQRTSESGFFDPTNFEQPGLAKNGASMEKNRDDEQWGLYSRYHYAEDGTATPTHKHNGATWGIDPTRTYTFKSNNSLRGKFHATYMTGPSQSHFGRGSGRNGERRGYIHVLREPTLPR